jgi:hypothetical protein
MPEQEPVREPASPPCQAPPGYWEGDSPDDEGGQALGRLWERLLRVRNLVFVARSASRTGWNGEGRGSVSVEQGGEASVTFEESGVWTPEVGGEIRFRNVFRWSKAGAALRLEHLRFGEGHAVYLFDLVPVSEREWVSASPHLCRADHYAAALAVRDDDLLLRWSVTGPEKQETIEYTYS